MNYKNRNNYKVISEADYKKLSYDLRISYEPTSLVVSHRFEDDVLTSLSMMAVGSMLFGNDDSSPSSSSDDSNMFGGFGDGDFGGGGAGGEW